MIRDYMWNNADAIQKKNESSKDLILLLLTKHVRLNLTPLSWDWPKNLSMTEPLPSLSVNFGSSAGFFFRPADVSPADANASLPPLRSEGRVHVLAEARHRMINPLASNR